MFYFVTTSFRLKHNILRIEGIHKLRPWFSYFKEISKIRKIFCFIYNLIVSIFPLERLDFHSHWFELYGKIYYKWISKGNAKVFYKKQYTNLILKYTKINKKKMYSVVEFFQAKTNIQCLLPSLQYISLIFDMVVLSI